MTVLAALLAFPAPATPAVDVNGCQEATLTDLTGQSNVTITFSGLTYSPACVRVSLGTNVTFSGSFASHPLRGGTWDGINLTLNTTGPIQSTDSGASATFTMTGNGAFGYLCLAHYQSGGLGAIYVGQDLILATGFES